MCRSSILALVLAVVLLTAGAAFANPTAPTTAPSPAMADILQGLSGPPAGAQLVFVNHCEPPTRFPCVNKQCQCGVTCGSRGIKSFTCDPNTFVSSCVCN